MDLLRLDWNEEASSGDGSNSNTNSFCGEKLIGREKECQILRQLRDQVQQPNQPSATVVIHGPSGSGKTALCRHTILEATTNNSNSNNSNSSSNDNGSDCCYCISGKFDQHHQDFSLPYSALVQAFDGLGQRLLEQIRQNGNTSKNTTTNNGESNNVDILRSAIRTSLSMENASLLLLRLIPSFQRLYDDVNDKNNKEDEEEKVVNDQATPSSPSSSITSSILTRSTSSSSSMTSQSEMSSGESEEGFLASERLAVAFRSFLATFCCHERPLLLMIDDVQWADPNSAQVLSSIINSHDCTNVLFAVCFRDDDDDDGDNVREGNDGNGNRKRTRTEFCNSLKKYQSIPVRNLDQHGVSQLVRKVLQTSQDIEELAQIIHQKTLGNPYFCLQILTLLHRSSLLTYHVGRLQWEWNTAEIQSLDVADNVADVVLKRLQRIPQECRRLLSLISCLGYYTTLDILTLIWKSNIIFDEAGKGGDDDVPDLDEDASSDRLDQMLASVESEGFLERLHNDDGQAATVKFSHDRFQETAYNLIDDEQRQRVHWKIGNALLTLLEEEDSSPSQKHSGKKKQQQQGASGGDDETIIYTTADQLNRGCSCLESETDRMKLIVLNFRASKLAGKKSSFKLVAFFLQKAIALSNDDDWNSQRWYNLMLGIHSRAVEVEAARGNFDRAEDLVSIILSKAKSPVDCRRARTANAQAYGWKFQFDLAIAEVREVIKLCGEELAPSSARSVKEETTKLRRRLEKFTNEELLSLPPMTDPLKITCMKVLKLGMPFGWSSDPAFKDLCLLKSMECTLKYGHCVPTGGFAYSGYGCVLSDTLEFRSEAFRFSRISLQVPHARSSVPANALNVYCFLAHIKLPVSLSVDPMIKAYQVGLETGDHSFGSICCSIYAAAYVMTGLPLKTYLQDMQKFAEQLKLCMQDFLLCYVGAPFRSAQVLASTTATTTEGDGMDEDTSSVVTWKSLEVQNFFNDGFPVDVVVKGQPAESYILWWRIFTQYILREYDEVGVALDEVLKVKLQFMPGFHYVNIVFILMKGLAGVALHKKTKKLQFRKRQRFWKIATEASEWLIESSKTGSVDCLVTLRLLEAEMATTQHRRKQRFTKEEIKIKFEEALSQLSRAGLTHYAAIANERLGEYMIEQQNDQFWGEHYLNQAAKLYNEWGASRKVRLMSRDYKFIVLENIVGGSNMKGASLRGRARSSSILKKPQHDSLLQTTSFLTGNHSK